MSRGDLNVSARIAEKLESLSRGRVEVLLMDKVMRARAGTCR